LKPERKVNRRLMMNKVEILEEMLSIYEKYFKAVLEMGTIQMSPKDKQRLEELRIELESLN